MRVDDIMERFEVHVISRTDQRLLIKEIKQLRFAFEAMKIQARVHSEEVDRCRRM
jgi:hypothetical protein